MFPVIGWPRPLSGSRPGRRFPGWVLAVACLAATGCVARTLTVTSEPVAAEVIVDGRQVGLAPVTVDVRHGGVRELILLAPGFEPAILLHDTERFWRDTPPFDAVADLVGGDDRQELHVTLRPERSLTDWDADKEAVLRRLAERAATLRARLQLLPALPADGTP